MVTVTRFLKIFSLVAFDRELQLSKEGPDWPGHPYLLLDLDVVARVNC